MHRRALVLFLSLSLLLTGCALIGGGSRRTMEAREAGAFEVFSGFYCAKKRWPTDWEEALRFAVEREDGGHALSYFGEPQILLPRAILLTLVYKDVAGAERRVSFVAPPQCGAEADPATVSMAAGRVTFKLPHGYSVLGGKAIEERWKRPPYPDAAWEDGVSGVVIALRFGEAELPPGGIAAIKSKLERSYQDSVTGLSWIVRKIKKQGKAEFLLHEYESDSIKGRLLSASLTFSFDGRPLTVNVIGPVAQRHAVEMVAEQLYGSLHLE